MGSRCKTRCGLACGISCVLVGIFLVVIGVVEKLRMDPFYTPLQCTHAELAVRMSDVSWPHPMNEQYGLPVGSEPYGLYGKFTTLVQTCTNPNEFDLLTRMEGTEAFLYLPNYSNPVDYKPYLQIATSNQTQDITLHAKKTTEIRSMTYGTASYKAFVDIGVAAGKDGYAPLYTKLVGQGESCLTLFGFKICEQATQVSWCGTLGGPCFVNSRGTNKTEPAICALTRAVCRSNEADMVKLTTPYNLGLTTTPGDIAMTKDGLQCLPLDSNRRLSPKPRRLDSAGNQEDVPQEKWENEWAPLVGMGGCAVIPSAKDMGVMCTTDLSTHPVISASAPGIKGSLCDKCPVSCKAQGQECLSSPAPATSNSQGDLPQDRWEKEWAPLKKMGGCTVIAAADSVIGVMCTTDLSTNAGFQASAPGIKGSLCDKCAASCKAHGQDCPSAATVATTASPSAAEAKDPEDVTEDKWEKEWTGLKSMGGCGAIDTAKSMGIMCTTDLSTQTAIQAAAPGIKGSFCDKCAASCKAEGQECPSSQPPSSTIASNSQDDVPQDVWEKEWAPLKAMGGCNIIPTAKNMGIFCITDLATHAMISASAPGIQGSLCDKCAASCKSQGQECQGGGQNDGSDVDPTQKVKLTYTLSNLVYNKVNADQAMKGSVVLAIKEGVLAELPGYSVNDLEVALSAGSIVAMVIITPKPNTTAAELSSTLSSVKQAASEVVMAKVVALPNLASILATGKLVSDINISATSASVATITCRYPSAVGIDENMLMQAVPGYVDGPDPNQDDLDKAELYITYATSIVIGVGCILVLVGSVLLCCLCKAVSKAPPATSAGAHSQPTILTSTPDGKSEASV